METPDAPCPEIGCQWNLLVGWIVSVVSSTVIHEINTLPVYSVCVATLVRIYTITKMKNQVDITWAIGDAMIWSNVEPCIGIVSACLPTLRPVIRLMLSPRIWAYFSSNKGGSHMYSDENPSSHPQSNGSRRVPQFQPEDDEIYLTTNIGRGDSAANSEDERESSHTLVIAGKDSTPMHIKVNRDFHMSSS